MGVQTPSHMTSSQFSRGKEWTRLDHLIHRAAMPLDEHCSKSEFPSFTEREAGRKRERIGKHEKWGAEEKNIWVIA